MKYIFLVEDIDCGNCANKIEAALNKEDYINEASLNFILKKLVVDSNEEDKERLREKIERLANRIEKGVRILREEEDDDELEEDEAEHNHHDHEGCGCGEDHNHEEYDHHHDHAHQECCTEDHHHHHNHEQAYGECCCGDEHHHEEHKHHHHHSHKHTHEECCCTEAHEYHHHERCESEEDHYHEDHEHHHYSHKEGTAKYTFIVENLDCGNCANKIEAALNKEEYIEAAALNFVLKKLTVESTEQDEEKLREKIEVLANHIEKGVRIVGESNAKKAKHKGHNHEEDKMGQKDKWLILAGVVLLLAGIVTDINVLFFASYICLGYDIVWLAVRNLCKGQMLDENFLMTIATVAAFIIGEYPEAVAVMLFYKIGEYMQGKAVGYSRKEIAKAMDIRPEFARVIRNGKTEVVEPQKVKVKEIIEVRAGEKIPLDGTVVEGSSLLDTSMLTGEAIPTVVKEGSEVLSGSINKEGMLKVKVTKSFKNSTVSKILELIENATSKKSESEKFITKFAKWYTPIVVGLAVFTAIVPSLITGNWHDWLYTSIIFLVISCPCAIVVSVPLGFFAGLGASAHKGVLVKGSNYLEQLNSIDTVVLDKTGTITKGQFGITHIETFNGSEKDVLKYAASLEQNSNHPIARSIVQGYEGKNYSVNHLKEVSGEGMVAEIGESRILAGNKKLMERYHIAVPEINKLGSYVYVAKDDAMLGCVVVADQIKEDSKEAIAKLKANGIKKVVMLTGDKTEIAKEVGKTVGVDEVHAELLPQDKVAQLEALLNEGKVAFVGDGINDAPVLARADIGIAMGGVGSDAAIEAADVVLMTDELSSIGEVLGVARYTRKIVKQNIAFALGVKVIVMLLSLVGFTNMWLAIFADVGVSLIAVMNSIRVLGGNLDYIRKMITSK